MPRRKRARQEKFRGMMVNREMPEPDAPGKWVDEARCHVDGEHYGDFRQHGCDWQEGVNRVRSMNGGYSAGGGFRSRGPIAWAMHVCKLQEWYLRHAMCGDWWDGRELADDEEVTRPPWTRKEDPRISATEAADLIDEAGSYDEAIKYVPDDEFGF